MRGRCSQCGDQKLKIKSDDVFRVGVPWLTRLLQREVDYVCAVCGREVKGTIQSFVDRANYRLRTPRPPGTENKAVERQHAIIHNASAPTRRGPTLSYPAAFSAVDQVLFPTFEGTIGDGTVVNQHGDPELMADFAEEYLRQFWVLIPTDRLPNTLKEIMPALLLLFTATELALKAFWIRSGRQLLTNHSLTDLYRELDPEHRRDIEGRFAKSELHAVLSALDADAPTVELILNAYSGTYGGASNVHMDSRYYAEPTTMFREASGLRGANLVKGNTPYPIFLPSVVRSLIDAYRFYSGPERLKRLGAELSEDGGERDNDNHGEWGLVPSSLGLVVVMVLQSNGMGLGGKEVGTFTEFKRLNPTNFIIDWMYGGNTLLFYLDRGQGFPDGKRVIDGLECRVWNKRRVGMHERDLHSLADAIDGSNKGVRCFGHLPNIGVDNESSS